MSKQIGEWRGMTRRRYTTLHSYTLHVRIHFTRTSDRYSFRSDFRHIWCGYWKRRQNLHDTSVRISFSDQYAECVEDNTSCDWKKLFFRSQNCKLAAFKRHVDDQAPSVTGNAKLHATSRLAALIGNLVPDQGKPNTPER